MARTAWTMAIGLGAFLVNPGWACQSGGGSDDEADFDFGEAEMRAAIEGSYKGSLSDGRAVTLNVSEAQASSSAEGPSTSTDSSGCITRGFIKPAGACVESSELQLFGRLTVADSRAVQILMKGSFAVVGLTLTNGELYLWSDNGTNLSATYEAVEGQEGKLTNLSISLPGSETASGTIEREPTLRPI